MSKVQEFLNKLAGETTSEETVDVAMLDKLANQNETIEASTDLAIASEYLSKLAEAADGDELLSECAEGLMVASQNLMTGLNKIAADNAAGMVIDMVETQDGLSKIASVLNVIAEEAENEEFSKVANAVTTHNNTLFDELMALAENDESVAQYIANYHAAE